MSRLRAAPFMNPSASCEHRRASTSVRSAGSPKHTASSHAPRSAAGNAAAFSNVSSNRLLRTEAMGLALLSLMGGGASIVAIKKPQQAELGPPILLKSRPLKLAPAVAFRQVDD